MRVLIIAEAGVNHNGSLDLAIDMVRKAKEIGADVIKFQTALPELVTSEDTPKADYQINNTGANESQLEMLKKIHLKLEDYSVIKNECDLLGIEFMSTPFDNVSIKYLNDLAISRFKIPSGEINNIQYLRKIAECDKDIIISTGMADMNEIESALDCLINAGMRKERIIVLHCTTDYPTKMCDVNLKAMNKIKEEFSVDVGYSDHTEGIEVSIAAVTLGASVIEKHFTLDKNFPGPDHKASLSPEEFQDMVSSIRNIEIALGSELKKPTEIEVRNKNLIRRSIFANGKILKGEAFSEENLILKRPGTGRPASDWDSIIGSISNKNYNKGDMI